MKIWRPDGSVVEQETITSHEASVGNDVAEGRVDPEAYWPTLVGVYRRSLATRDQIIRNLRQEREI